MTSPFNVRFVYKVALFLLVLLFSIDLSAQKEIDSLIHLLQSAKKDTFQLSILNQIAEKSTDDNVWPIYNKKMEQLSLDLMNSKNAKVSRKAKIHYANSQINTGYLHNMNGVLDSSVVYYQKALDIMQELGDKTGMAAALNNIGYVFKSQGDILSALDCYHRSLKLYESMKDEKGIANSLNNLAIIYSRQGDTKTAINYNLRSIEITKKLKDSLSLGISMNNLALLYHKRNKPEEALKNLREALVIQEKIGDQEGVANSYNNIGYVYEESNDIDKALENYLLAYRMSKSGSDKPVLVSTAINVGTLYLKKKNTTEAAKYAQEALQLAKEIEYVNELADAADLMSQVYKTKNDYKNALEMHEYYIKLKDSALNESTRKAALQMKYQYAYEKKAVADSIKNNEAQKVKDAQIAAQESALKQEKTLKYVLFFGLALFIAISIYAYYRYRDTQRKNTIIARQKEIVDEKQKEIIDSITYAKRIQLALLKEEAHVSKHLPEHFVLFQPKDIVSGDFYWSLEKTEANTTNKYWYLTVADCTGHGVPGAFLTMLGTSFLNEINATPDLLSPNEILDQLRIRFIRDLNQSGRIGENKDGMDMSIFRLNLSTYELEWAGANHPLWLLKKNADQSVEFIEVKGDKSPIGYSDKIEPFSNFKFKLGKGDQLFLFTDGYADQFGGEKKKKFKRSQLKDLLLSIAEKPSLQQKQDLEQAFYDWKADMEQVDDVCVIGIRI
ncbi:MAG: tetratricopeptide repeat protein [Bacteroidia bacterium]|nr:tetratricopeptide repeat protein [Bacteroidia bacterium]